MKKTMTVDGNEACSYSAYMFTEFAGIYPITPSSPMAEHIDSWSNNNLNIFNDKVKVVEMQSEAGAIGLVHGALSSGLLTTTFTSSQGLLLMLPNMYKIAGEMLPCVIHVAARSLATHALSIFGDHQDVYAASKTGFCMLASSSVQDAAYLSAVAHLSAIKASIPFLHFFDGFRTSHEIQKIEVLEKEDYIDLVDFEAINNFRKRSLNINHPFTKGTAQNDDIYFQVVEAKNSYYDKVPDIVNDYMQKINKKAGTNYKPFNYYGSKQAKNVIVAMGSVCETIKETISYLKDVGLIEVHLYRPFSLKYLIDVLPDSVKNIAVLDRTKEHGSSGEPLYLDIVASLKDKNINIVHGIYGLSSKDTTPSQIKAIYDMLKGSIQNKFTIGIIDDVTNLSLKEDKSFKLETSDELLIYGFGSDGMVSASKTIIKLIGDNTKKYVQGYFQYDSKKSGGVTISHLRFSENKIQSAYYVQNPKLIVLSKDNYLNKFELLSSIKKDGIFLLNTSKSNEEISKLFSNKDKEIIKQKNISIYKINAYQVASKCDLGNKISTIMESATVKLLNIIDYDLAIQKLKEYATKKFMKKGELIVDNNIKAIDMSLSNLEQISIDDKATFDIIPNPNSLYDMMIKREGNNLPVSMFIDSLDGRFEANTSTLEKRNIAEVVPLYNASKCIACNLCSFVCPHSVIRPFLLSEEEYKMAPNDVKIDCKETVYKQEKYYFTIGISALNCTGCKVCINTCPSGALIPSELEMEEKKQKQKIFDYLDKNVTNKHLYNENTIKGSQFIKPKFAYSGACSGCGETAYLKLLTQLFGNNLVIANATGCSSIYGASAPITPYNIPWSNSLFEDNAEFGLGIYLGNKKMRFRIKNIMENNMNNPNKDLFKKWILNMDDYDITKEVYDCLDYNTCPKEISDLKDYLTSSTTWIVGGDGWAYDIGFSGIDHVLASDENINILVLDSQVYSNTGGQSSKSSPKGSIASFTSTGKKQNNKDLARIALAYPNAYVAQVCLGANGNQVIKAFNEAKNHHGPSIIIAYCPCISHGIDGGLENSIDIEKLAVNCGYFLTFRRNPINDSFILDCNPDFNLYEEFLNRQIRYKMLHKINKEHADELIKENKENAIKKYEYYAKLDTNLTL